jgi:energy-coupling factor transport system substrate-specific component
VSQTWLRVGAGLVVFALIGIGGIAGLAGLEFDEALDSFTLVMIVAIPAGIAAYALVEYLQTRRLDSITGQFDTRTLVLMPVAMALNIVLGTAVASALKIPIYLDSIGTILVAALAGPLAGAATGFLSNVIWTYLAPPPFGSPFAVPFAVVAVVIGLLAGTFARWGWLRPRPGSSNRQLLIGGVFSLALVALMASLAISGWSAAGEELRASSRNDDSLLYVLGWAALLLVGAAAVGLLVLLGLRRDLAAAYVVAAGVITGVVAAFIAAPIASGIFGGVTGSGADFVIAAFRQAGADIQQAVLGQSLISDPVDKVITYFAVYLILGAMATRVKARFPQGDYLLPLPHGEDGDEPGT